MISWCGTDLSVAVTMDLSTNSCNTLGGKCDVYVWKAQTSAGGPRLESGRCPSRWTSHKTGYGQRTGTKPRT
jgi:hypothetical protein